MYGILFYSVFTALLCTSVSVLLNGIGFPQLEMPAEFAFFLVIALFVQLQKKDNFGDAAEAFLIAQGAYVLLVFCGSEAEMLCFCIGGCCLFWFGIVLIILMNAYKKERITVLVEQQYRGEMQSFMNVIRSQRHDYNFHVQTIAGLIPQGKIEECGKYVKALEQDAFVMNAVLPIKDPAISAMIHNFQTLAAREGIECPGYRDGTF